MRLGDFLAADMARGDAAARSSVDVLTFVRAAVEAANHRHGLSIDMPVTLPGASIRLFATVIEPPQILADAQKGSIVRTAQVRLRILVDLDLATGGNPLLRLSGDRLRVRLPLYAELASGSAELREISCSAGKPDAVELRARAGAASFWIGSVREHLLQDTNRNPTPIQANLTSIDMPAARFSIHGFAHAAIAEHTRDLRIEGPFTPTKTASIAGSDGEIVRPLLADLELQLDAEAGAVGLGRLAVSPLSTGLTQLLTSTAAPVLDTVIGAALRAFGVRLGVLDIAVGEGSCGAIRMVQ